MIEETDGLCQRDHETHLLAKIREFSFKFEEGFL